MPLSSAVDLDTADTADTAPPARTPVRALESVPEPVVDRLPPHGCVTVAFDGGRECIVRLSGALERDGIARIDAVLDAVSPMPWPLVIDLSAARTRDRRLWRVLADLVGRRRDAGRRVVLEGVHPGVVPDLETVSLPETFLVFQAVCSRPV